MRRVLMICMICFLMFNLPSYAANIRDVIADKSALSGNNVQKVIGAFQSDVYSYYDIARTYDTPLKRKNYEATEEYKIKAKELAEVRADMLKKKHYITLKPYRDFTWTFGDYSLDKKGFFLKRETPTEGLYSYNPGEIEDVFFEKLPIERGRYYFFGKEILVERLLVPVDEKVASSIEKNPDVALVIAFGIQGISGYRNIIAGCPTEAYVFNKVSGEIYTDKVYDCPPKPESEKAYKKPPKRKKKNNR